MRTVLIADDDAHVLRVLRLAIERAGYRVDTVSNGEEALDYLHSRHPDLLITDIRMPCMTGDELCRRIQAEVADRRFPILVSTSRTEAEYRELASVVPNLMFMEKPLSVRKLISRMHGLFEAAAS